MIDVAQNDCQRDLIAAYVDGELNNRADALFEQHLEDCFECRSELRAQRLFVCELDAVMAGSVEVPVPDDFSRLIAVRASSDLRGVRTKAEHRKAIVISALLALTGFGLLSSAARDAVLVLIGKFLSTMFSLAGFLANVVYDLVVGVLVIFRVAGHKIVIESGSFRVLLVVLAAGVLVLSRLISSYHRPEATE